VSAVAVKRDKWWVSVEDERGGVSGHAIKLQAGHSIHTNITLRGCDQLLINKDELEIYIDLERLSDLHAMLGTFIKEAEMLLGGD